MRATDFFFELPESLIVHYPMPERSSCRLLSLDGPTDTLTHGIFTNLPDKLNPDDFLVLNSTRVIPARLFGHRASGGKIEVLIERVLDDRHILVHIHALKASKPGVELLLDSDESVNATMTACRDALFEVEFNGQHSVLDILNSIDHTPLPPYIDCPGEDADHELYQTVYSEKPSTVAIPTVGLHFGGPLLEKLRVKGTEIAFVMLHVDAGIFQPMRVDAIEDHITHLEYAEVPQNMVDTALATETCGNRVIAVDTTPVHSLESAVQATKNDLIEPFFDDTQISIYPDSQYKAVGALVMNFHLPELMLIMLASTFASYQHTISAYKAAVEEKYRFFSYDDAVFITYNPRTINERVGE